MLSEEEIRAGKLKEKLGLKPDCSFCGAPHFVYQVCPSTGFQYETHSELLHDWRAAPVEMIMAAAAPDPAPFIEYFRKEGNLISLARIGIMSGWKFFEPSEVLDPEYWATGKWKTGLSKNESTHSVMCKSILPYIPGMTRSIINSIDIQNMSLLDEAQEKLRHVSDVRYRLQYSDHQEAWKSAHYAVGIHGIKGFVPLMLKDPYVSTVHLMSYLTTHWDWTEDDLVMALERLTFTPGQGIVLMEASRRMFMSLDWSGALSPGCEPINMVYSTDLDLFRLGVGNHPRAIHDAFKFMSDKDLEELVTDIGKFPKQWSRRALMYDPRVLAQEVASRKNWYMTKAMLTLPNGHSAYPRKIVMEAIDPCYGDKELLIMLLRAPHNVLQAVKDKWRKAIVEMARHGYSLSKPSWIFTKESLQAHAKLSDYDAGLVWATLNH
jgi:hypothetical protein